MSKHGGYSTKWNIIYNHTIYIFFNLSKKRTLYTKNHIYTSKDVSSLEKRWYIYYIQNVLYCFIIMFLRLSRLLSTIIMLILNTLATTLPLNGITTKQLSDWLSTLITPAGFTFAIWSVIYLGLIGLTIAIVSKKIILPDKVMIWYIVSSLANGLRIVVRHYQDLHLAMIIILLLLISLIIIDRTLLVHRDSISYFHRVRGSILLYFGRVQIATLLMTIIYTQYQIGLLTGYEVPAGIAVITLAWSANLLIIWREKNIITSLVALRALWGIINGQTDPQIILTAQIVMCVLVGGITSILRPS